MLLYIDPGTGSMLFTILIGVIGAAFYALRNLIVKIQFVLSGGREAKMNENKLPYVIYTDSKRYWNSFESICDEFEKRGLPLTYMTSSPDDEALEKDYKHVKCEFIGEGNKAFAKLNLLNASVLLSTTPGLDVYQWKRSRNVDWYVHIPHAAGDLTMYRMFGIDYYDSILTCGQYQIDQIRDLEHVRNLPEKEMEIVGIPYLDAMKRRLDAAAPLENHEKTVLLAPSWGPSAILSKYGERMIDALLATGYHIVVRPHPQSFTSEKDMLDKLMDKYPALEWNKDNDNFEVLRRADILISDFSGVIFDYALVFDKPVIYADTQFDDAIYDCCWLEDETWTFQTLPRIGQSLKEEDIDNIKSVIDECIASEKYQAARDRAREEAWQCQLDGAANITDYMIKSHDRILAEQEAAKKMK